MKGLFHLKRVATHRLRTASLAGPLCDFGVSWFPGVLKRMTTNDTPLKRAGLVLRRALCQPFAGAWEWLVISAVFGLRTHQLRLFFLVLCACTQHLPLRASFLS